MNLSDIIEEYILDLMNQENEDSIELKRCDIASHFNCVPSQINYVISTRFVPELGFYVQSRRGGGGCIKINKIDLDDQDYISNILEKTGSKLSQKVVNIYIQNLLKYNVIDQKTAKLISASTSDKALENVNILKKDQVRADIFKNLIINLI